MQPLPGWVPREGIEQCLLTAGSAPSGANQQPWFFAVIIQPDNERLVVLLVAGHPAPGCQVPVAGG